MKKVVHRRGNNMVFFVVGLCFFIVGIYLMSDMLMEFLKFFVGLIIFLIGLQMVLGVARYRFMKV